MAPPRTDRAGSDAAALIGPRRNELRTWAGIGDRALGGAIIISTLPLLLLVAIAIKLDSVGPVLVRQERLSPDGRRVCALSFRTTIGRQQRAVVGATGRTRIGELLWYTRIEELPQLFNVLRGEISLRAVGALRRDCLGE
ncbi:MAG TPA: sugar transferase [Stellaceae bacterium]|nr:sugar transferase [Stellaceae bacterium]